jgi:hypothetical protein
MFPYWYAPYRSRINYIENSYEEKNTVTRPLYVGAI